MIVMFLFFMDNILIRNPIRLSKLSFLIVLLLTLEFRFFTGNVLLYAIVN